MDAINFDKLVLKSAFCCMVADGSIDDSEVATIRSKCVNSYLFADFDFISEINNLVNYINKDSQQFTQAFFTQLENSNLTEEEELIILDFSIDTIKADSNIEYREIKMLKNIRHRMKLSNEKILLKHPDIEYVLEDDILNENKISSLTQEILEEIGSFKFEILTHNT